VQQFIIGGTTGWFGADKNIVCRIGGGGGCEVEKQTARS